MLNLLKNLVLLKGKDGGRRVIGLVAIVLSAVLYFGKGISVPVEEMTQSIDPMYTGIYGFIIYIMGILNAKT